MSPAKLRTGRRGAVNEQDQDAAGEECGRGAQGDGEPADAGEDLGQFGRVAPDLERGQHVGAFFGVLVVAAGFADGDEGMRENAAGAAIGETDVVKVRFPFGDGIAGGAGQNIAVVHGCGAADDVGAGAEFEERLLRGRGGIPVSPGRGRQASPRPFCP